ncbi:MAG: ribosomal protein S18-alanine N-acetyltransferase [Terracidiphilus sp.]
MSSRNIPDENPAGAKAQVDEGAFSARLKPHPIDEDLSMGTPVKSCPDTRQSLSADGQAVAIRRMTPADLNRVMEIAESLKEAPRWPRTAFERALDPAAQPRRIALVVEGMGAVAGFAVASLLPPEAELETIAVAATAQRHGLARRLFTELAAELAVAQITEVFLEVRSSNQPALGSYRQLGFAETGRRVRYYHEPVEDAVLMRLRLEGA